MTETKTTQVYQVFIKATPEAIWDAITKPEWTQRYGYRSTPSSTCGPAAATAGYARDARRMGMPEVVVEGEVIEADPPRKLVHTWRFLWDPRSRPRAPRA